MIMEPADWYIRGSCDISDEEISVFEEWMSHLPKRIESTPYHSGPHSIRHFRNAFNIARLDPRKINDVVEVGFCLGHSAEIMLRMGATHVTSIEISSRDQTMQAKKAMDLKWKGAHRFLSTKEIGRLILDHQNYDTRYAFGFIDGDHSAEAIASDIDLMRALHVPWVLFDDFWPHWGDTQIVMKEQGITPVAILGTMALCHFP